MSSKSKDSSVSHSSSYSSQSISSSNMSKSYFSTDNVSSTSSSGVSEKSVTSGESKTKSSAKTSQQQSSGSITASTIGASQNKSGQTTISSNSKSSVSSYQSTSFVSGLSNVSLSSKASSSYGSNKTSKSGTKLSKSGTKASKSMASSAINISIEPSSIPGRPKLCEKLDEINHIEPYIKIDNENEIQSNGGFKIKNFIVADDCYKYYSAEKNSNEIICKKMILDKCTPRYRENILKNSLKIARFIGGTNGSPPISKHFIDIMEIFRLGSHVFMFMENCPNKSMYLMLIDHDNYLPEDERRWTVQIVKGIAKMQEYGIAHRFLKLQHILFDSNQNVKIAGWSKSVLFWDSNNDCPLLQNGERRSRKNCHLPPESFRGVYDPSKVDMWSLGVIMVCLQTRSYPFNVNSTSKFSAQWRQFVVKHEMNRYVRAACNQTFFIDPKRRARPTDFLNHPYFNTPNSNIKSKVLKTTEDPKYDPNMPEELSYHVSTTAVVSGANSQSGATSESNATTTTTSWSKSSSATTSNNYSSSANKGSSSQMKSSAKSSNSSSSMGGGSSSKSSTSKTTAASTTATNNNNNNEDHK
ncbi:serine/threonine kinase-like protein 1 [Dermatophagoides farinae]|uniref:Serine/threonine kinase-like protein 1 n=1 Tax=Dermatophagoides farinae TaxID=6954 RepID=A0A9D4P9I0_DERFA|nr:serine/threonine kinase-like protein 1 [Dermatophagoides farinae]